MLILRVCPCASVILCWPRRRRRRQRAAAAPTFSKEQLDQMMAPIALYPDSLPLQILMAATYPADVAGQARHSVPGS